MRWVTDPTEVARLAAEREDENWEFRRWIKVAGPDDGPLDALLRRLARQVWADIDCTQCGNCCTVVIVPLTQDDLTRLAAGLGLTTEACQAQYLQPDEADWRNDIQDPSGYVLPAPCPFLHDRRCAVYPHRPTACRAYPYLDQLDFRARTLAMLDRVAQCPVVYNVWEELKAEVGWR